MELKGIIEILERHMFNVHEYNENGVLCGYEIETWTLGGVNMLHFIDCRCEEGVTPETVFNKLKDIVDNFDIDQEIDLHREDERYRKVFSIRESLNDFDEYLNRLSSIVEEIEEALND